MPKTTEVHEGEAAADTFTAANEEDRVGAAGRGGKDSRRGPRC